MPGLRTTFAISINGNGNGTTAGLIMTTEWARGNEKHYLSSSEWMCVTRLIVRRVCRWFLCCYSWCVVSTVWLSALLSASGAARNPSCWPWCNRTLWVHQRKCHFHPVVRRRGRFGRFVCTVESESVSTPGKNLWFKTFEIDISWWFAKIIVDNPLFYVLSSNQTERDFERLTTVTSTRHLSMLSI